MLGGRETVVSGLVCPDGHDDGCKGSTHRTVVGFGGGPINWLGTGEWIVGGGIGGRNGIGCVVDSDDPGVRVEIKIDASGVSSAKEVELAWDKNGVAQPADLAEVGLTGCGEGL